MKSPYLLTLGSLTLALASCGSFKNLNRPLSGQFDPLSSPGPTSENRSAMVAPTSPSYKRGQWVVTSMDNATFFRAIPRGGASADRVLSAGTPMKVVSSTGTYVKVELDTGDVGYVPEIMVTDRKTADIPAPGVVPEFGSVPPPVEPDLVTPGIDAPPGFPDGPPPVPAVPDFPVAPAPSIPESVPTVPGIAPPPTVPGVTD